MGWLRERYNTAYLLRKDKAGKLLPYGADGVEYWEQGGLRPSNKIILDAFNVVNAVILDIGFGRGEIARYCLQKGAAYVVGVDFSEDALKIAKSTLQDFPSSRYALVCDDILNFFSTTQAKLKFNYVLMFDVIEHIPRNEVEKIIPALYKRLTPGGFLVAHTPLYPRDCDLSAMSLPKVCRDDTDEYQETIGMHVNRYSQGSLGAQFRKFGFIRLSDYVFLRPKAAIINGILYFGDYGFWHGPFAGRIRTIVSTHRLIKDILKVIWRCLKYIRKKIFRLIGYSMG